MAKDYNILRILRYINLLILLASKVFIKDITYQMIFLLFCSILPLSTYSLENNSKKKNKITWIIILLITISLILFFIFLQSDYGISNAMLEFGFLLIAYLEFSDESAKIYSDKFIFKIAYILLTVLLIYWLIYNLKASNSYFYFYNLGYDKNYSGILIFFYFAFCLKNDFKIGQVISCIYALLLKSRLLLFVVIFIYIFTFLIKNKSRIKVIDAIINRILNFKTKGIVGIFFVLTAIVSMFSFLVVKYVPTSSIANYGESLNDTSNAIRVRANYYALETIINNPQFIFYGYDGNIKEALGVEDEITATKYMGFRLVQPHNFILNYILRYGFILTIIYVAVLSKILSRWWNKKNIPIITAYIFMNMAMHSLLSTIYLILFLLIVVLDKPLKKDSELNGQTS